MRIYFSFFLVINFFVWTPSFCQNTIGVKHLLEQGELLMAKKPNEAFTLFDKALSISRRLKYDSGIGVATCKLASLKSLSDIQASINFFRESVPYLLRVGNITLAGGALYTLAEFHERKSNLDSSIYYCMEAVYLNERQQDHIDPAWLYAMISSLYLYIDQYDKSLFYAKKTIGGSDYSDYVALGCIAMSKAFKAMKRIDSALLYANIPLRKIKDIQPFYLCQVYNNLAEMYLLTHRVDSALYYLNEVETLYKYNPTALRDKLITFLLASDIWLAKNDVSRSRYYLDKSISLIREKSYTIHLPDLYERLSKLHFQLGMYKEAFLYSDSATLVRGLLSDSKNRYIISDLETKYQTAQKEKALSHKVLQLHESRQYLGLSVAAAVVAILGGALVFANYRNKRQQQLQYLQQEKEIQLLQALMRGEEKERSRIAKDLHDGIAGMLAAAKMQLSSLSIKSNGLARSKEYQQAIQLLNDSTQEIRLTSHNLMPEVLLRYGLDEALRRYCSNISNEHLLKVRYESWGQIERYVSNFELSVYRIVQELLNNVLKHSKATEAFVQLSVKEETLFIFIEDNGIGLQQPVSKDGMGLQSLKARIKAMNGRFEVEASANRGVSAYLEFNTLGLEG